MEAPVAESHFECICGAVEDDGRIRRHCGACGYHTPMPANYCMDCGRAFAVARVVEVAAVSTRPPLATVPAPKARAPWSEQEESLLFSLVSDGKTLREIAALLGRSYSAVATRRYRQVA